MRFIHSNMERALASPTVKLEPSTSSIPNSSTDSNAARAHDTLQRHNGPAIANVERTSTSTEAMRERQLHGLGQRTTNIPNVDQRPESHGFRYSLAIAPRRWSWTSEHDQEHNLLYPYNYELGQAKKQKFYAVAIGRHPCIFLTWPEAKWLVHEYAGAHYEAFKSVSMAKQYLKQELATLPPLPLATHMVNCHYRCPDKQGHHVFKCECCNKSFCTNGKDGLFHLY